MQWGNALHEADFLAHTHNITTHNCEIDGDEAHTESYVIFVLRRKDERTVLVGGGRYLDRLEKRDGDWADRAEAADCRLALPGRRHRLGHRAGLRGGTLGP